LGFSFVKTKFGELHEVVIITFFFLHKIKIKRRTGERKYYA